VTAKRRYRGGVSKFLGFLLGLAVALAGPAVFGVLAAPGGIELNAKGMALAFGIGALIFWAVVSYFSGAGALGAFVAFGTLVYCWMWIPNRTTNFLNDIPGVTNGMIEGSKQYTLNGVVPILTVISLVYAIQLIVSSVQRRRRERAEAERLQREQEAAQAQQEAEAAALYPVAGSTYPAEGSGYGGSFGNSSRYDDLFDEGPEPVRPRSQSDEQTAQFPVSTPEQTAQFPGVDGPDTDAQGNDSGDETVLVPTDRDETTQLPTDRDETTQVPVDNEETVQAAAPTPPQPQPQEQPTVQANEQPTVAAPVATEEPKPAQRAEPQPQPQPQPVAEQPAVAAPVDADEPKPKPSTDSDEQPTVAAPVASDQTAPVVSEQPTVGSDQPTVAAPTAGDQPTVVAPPKAGDDQDTVAAPVEAGEQKPESQQAAAPQPEKKGTDGAAQQAAAPAVKEQMGQQYRERMDDPEDTGEFYISAFENPTQVSIRPAGA
jgi:hypothetical protein